MGLPDNIVFNRLREIEAGAPIRPMRPERADRLVHYAREYAATRGENYAARVVANWLTDDEARAIAAAYLLRVLKETA